MKQYTIKRRKFTAAKEKDPIKRNKLNSDVLTSEFSPEMKYQLVCMSTEFVFKDRRGCYDMLKKLDIPRVRFLFRYI